MSDLSACEASQTTPALERNESAFGFELQEECHSDLSGDLMPVLPETELEEQWEQGVCSETGSLDSDRDSVDQTTSERTSHVLSSSSSSFSKSVSKSLENSVRKASGIASLQEPVRSKLPELDRFLGGGIRGAAVYEWGLPFQSGGRAVLGPIVRAFSKVGFILWIYPPGPLQVFPPAWASLGVDLRKTRFIRHAEPFQALREVFLQPTFSLIVLDRPEKTSKAIWAFLAAQARKQGFTVFVLQDRLLQPGPSNPWATFRLQGKQLAGRQGYLLEGMRGMGQRNLLVPLPLRGWAACI